MDRPESELKIENKDRINKFLEDHVFDVDIVLTREVKFTIPVKMQITGTKKYIRVGEWNDYIEYTLIIEKSKPRENAIVKAMFPHYQKYEITTTNNPFFRLTSATDKLLENFLSYWGIDAHCIPTEAIVKVWENVSESVISESKYDSVVRKLVKDIISFVKKGEEGEYELPEDLGVDMVYDFPQLEFPITVELKINHDNNIKRYKVDANYYREEDVIEVLILINPTLGNSILQDLLRRLNEILMHEITHISQHERGFKFDDNDDVTSVEYYTKPEEIEAQYNGFMRRARKEKRTLDSIMDEWFEENEDIHGLSPTEIELVKQKIKSFRN